MGGAIGKDHGAMEYEERNIYLNSVKTYGRLKPIRPITIHQKALFCLWVFITCLFAIVHIVKLRRWILSTWKDKKTDGREEEVDDVERQNFVEERGKLESFANTKYLDEKKSEHENNKKPSIWERLVETSPEQPSLEKFLRQAFLFGWIMFYFWLCDFQHVWRKTDKQYSRDMFTFLFCLLVFVALVFTIKPTEDKILNRDQTEEWKGWMQVCIVDALHERGVQFVWFHYYDAQEVYNSIRCYVGSYVWMTGYGNFWYFYHKKDYSFFRLCKMMWRLNFLVVMVMAITNHEFVRYYVCAMHTYWFLTVYAMLAFFARYNDNRKIMATKFVLFFIFNSIIFEIPFIAYKVFWPFQFVLNVNGNLDNWIYRATLDHWATWIGMLVAYNYPYYDAFLRYLEKRSDNIRENSLKNGIKIGLTLFCIVIIVIWFRYLLLVERTWYRKYHPYSSLIPILAYIWLRNLHPFLRTRFLNLFNWLGKITLETYLSQIHIYMIGDARKLLVYIHKYPMLNFAVATVLYVCVSYVLFHQTVLFSSFLLPRNMRIVCRNFIASVLILLSCYIFSYLLTLQQIW
ncbi:protein REDUCED WALL ACETYLATION 4-like isoform X2 [Xenia sp. Carnegie-2017]|uniref:protein REDUCED WALL ACETYLATION 4-like isoform X2 n=1 Tax=Xenia sp. Carnegie-2017 TaxID=2897299 RepID=UPI001F03AC50|nr:protein REDUCED WALL ACETYLATION 4-like isoform X2 [Xenia sp. Carnegie-2017]